MERFINVAGAQLGPIARSESRQQVVSRLLELMREANARGSDIVVFPELALTTFFPRWWMEDDAEIDSFFEREMPSAASGPLFETAKSLGIGFYLGYAELVEQNGVAHHYNTAILVDKNAAIVGKYRKVHLPGHANNRPHYPFQHLEKRYFEPGDLGFPVWRAFGGNVGMCICNDRRWPETYRVMAMQSVELILLGYNTPTHLPWITVYDHLSDFHNHLCMQAGAYQNSTWVVGVAKGGNEEGSELLAGSCIVAPSGEIVAQSPKRRCPTPEFVSSPPARPSPSTERSRRYRQRRRRGTRCITVDVNESEVPALVARGYLPAEIKAAIEGVISDLAFELQQETSTKSGSRL